MEPTVKEDIIDVLDRAIKIIKEQRFIELSELSNHTIHDASIFQDEDSVSMAILIYSLSKTVQRCAEKGVPCAELAGHLTDARDALKDDELGKYNAAIKKLFEVVNSFDKKLKLYIEEVINKAKVKKGSKLYEHGISIARTANILGISQWELMSYVGKTSITDFMEEKVSATKRLQMARGLF